MNQQYKFPLFVARAKYWSWYLLTKFLLGIICIGVISEGLRLFVPSLGQKLHRLPGFAFARNFQETHSLDIAPFLAFFFMISVWYLIEKLLRVWLLAEPLATDGVRWNAVREEQLLKLLTVILLGMDGLLFYSASVTMQWGGSVISFTALLATLGYLAVLLFVSYVSAKLSVAVDALKELIALDIEELHEIEREAAADAAFTKAKQFTVSPVVSVSPV